jgi:hypothetical protein
MKKIFLNEKEPNSIMEKLKEKFSIERCKRVLEQKGKNFTENQILMIRDFLINVSRIAYQTFQKQVHTELDAESEKQSAIILQLTKEDSKETEIKDVA